MRHEKRQTGKPSERFATLKNRQSRLSNEVNKMGGELSKSDIAKRNAKKLRADYLYKSFQTPSMKKLGISPFNILVMGEVASGKSSAINAFVTAMHDDEEMYFPALSLGVQDNHVTTGYRCYTLPEKSGIVMFDAWGIYLNKTYLDDSLSKMLDGVMPDGGRETTSVLETKQSDERPSSYSTAESKGIIPGREIHMVVFCVSGESHWAQADDIVQADYEELSKMISMMKEINEKKGICSAALVTKVDLVTKQVLDCANPEEIRVLPEVAKCLNNVSKATGVPKSIVLPMVAQTDEFKRSPIVDCNAIHVLKTLMKIAEGYLEQKVARDKKGIK